MIPVDSDGRFYCEPLRCRLSKVSCKARFQLAMAGNKRHAEGPCSRCNVGRSLNTRGRMPKKFKLKVLKAPEPVASRDKAWGFANCLQCGTRFKKGSGNHLYFCRRRCAKRYYRPFKPAQPGLKEIETVMEGY